APPRCARLYGDSAAIGGRDRVNELMAVLLGLNTREVQSGPERLRLSLALGSLRLPLQEPPELIECDDARCRLRRDRRGALPRSSLPGGCPRCFPLTGHCALLPSRELLEVIAGRAARSARFT